MRAIDSTNAEHYRWGEVCDGWHLVRSDAMSVIEEVIPPGGSEVAHFHETARQFFYVLQGELQIQTDRGGFTLNTGQGLEIPPKAAHRVSNNSEAPVRFLLVSVPPAQGDRKPAQL